MVQEGQDVAFMIQLIGLAEIVVQVNFQTADGTATGKLNMKSNIRHLVSYSCLILG